MIETHKRKFESSKPDLHLILRSQTDPSTESGFNSDSAEDDTNSAFLTSINQITQTDLDQISTDSPCSMKKSDECPSITKKIKKLPLKSKSFPQGPESTSQVGTPSEKRKNKRWSKDENDKILQLIEKLGYDWTEIAKHFPGGNGKTLRDHYFNNLVPGINKDTFKPEEDDLLLNLIERLGTKWKMITNYMLGRTENQVKNRYYGHLKKIQEKRKEALEASIGVNRKLDLGSSVKYENQKKESEGQEMAIDTANLSIDHFLDLRSEQDLKTKIQNDCINL